MLTLSKLLTQACYEGFFKLGIKVMEKFISFTDLKTESYGSLYISQCVQYVLYQINIFIYECHLHLITVI